MMEPIAVPKVDKNLVILNGFLGKSISYQNLENTHLLKNLLKSKTNKFRTIKF